ncbi:NAD(P)-binding domain-containing protein [Bradyrhizobium sp. B120]|uniref:NAD(P)-binding domain-containing protein n=1 Tax=Bradyrhizobium sp. B120 TaxID=3410088 RepID=UPI003B9875E1
MTGTFAGQQPRLGILGAGRLGAAIALRWQSIGNQKAKVWSRRFDHHDADKPDDLPFGVASIASVMSADAVIAAIPSSGLAELASHHRAITEFSGTLLVTGIDLPLTDIQRLVPGGPRRACNTRSAVCSALHTLPRPQWRSCRRTLGSRGDGYQDAWSGPLRK